MKRGTKRPDFWVRTDRVRATPTAIGVVLVEPAGEARDRLASAFGWEPDVVVAGMVDSVDQAPSALGSGATTGPSVVVFGPTRVADGSYADFVRAVRTALPHLRVVLYGIDGRDEDVTRALFVGVHGVVHLSASPEDVVAAVRDVTRGNLVLVKIPDWAPSEGEVDGQTSPQPDRPPTRLARTNIWGEH
jgi:DNA-binding NarL/FixJ family response regulator